MSEPRPGGLEKDSARELEARNRELLRRIDFLDAEVRRLRQQNADVHRRLAEARLGMQADQKSRIAALNLMEDAVLARQAEHRETAERHRVEQGLLESELKYRSLFESIDEGFYVVEKVGGDLGAPLDFRYVEANPAFAAQSGVEAVLGRTVREVFPEESEGLLKIYDSVLRSGQPTRFEQVLASRQRVLELYIFSVKDEANGRVAGIFMDITARKHADDALRDADRRKDQFLAVLAHELRKPLAPLQNSLQLIAASHDFDSDVVGLLQVMRRQIDQMVRLIDELLDVSRISHGKIKLKRSRVNLHETIQTAIDANRPLMQSNGHRLSVRLAEDPLLLDADPFRIAQIVSNLLSNATKYTERGGQVELTTERVQDHVQIRIKDSGIGIPQEMLESIFELFSQVDASVTRSHGGLGIGLTLARNLVEMHGGTIRAESGGLGKGTELIVRLPLAADAGTPAVPTARTKPISDLQRHNVLIVDDARDASFVLCKLLEALGQTVRTACDGRSALQAMREDKPDVVFSDIAMPGMSGYELAETVRADPHLKDVPLVALTGYGQNHDKHFATDAGFNHHLIKPVAINALREVLAAFPASLPAS